MQPMTFSSALILAWAASAGAASFAPIPLFEEDGVQALNRTVTRDLVDRDLFKAPYATVVVGHVDVYDGFPYLEARYFQIVSDPAWDRLLYGEMGRGLAAVDGSTDSFGPLAGPRGLAVDGTGRVFVADTDNHRVLVYETWTEFDRMRLRPVFSIDDLSRPYDVAHSDGGSPFDPGDDRLYVAETGRNRVTSFALETRGATRSAMLGELGGGVGYFAGPVALTVGRSNGLHTHDLYVADSHNGRIVHLVDEGDRLRWAGEAKHEGGLVTSLETDHWGALYAASPQGGNVTKYSAGLTPVARLEAGVERPRGFHVPFVNRSDHRSGTLERAGQGSALVVEEWTHRSGIQLVRLGVEIDALRFDADRAAEAHFVLTDHGTVRAEIREANSGRVVHREELGEMNAGAHTVRLDGEALSSKLPAGDYVLRVSAVSSYEATPLAEHDVAFAWNEGANRALPPRTSLLGNEPNPFRESTTIRFAIPEGRDAPVSMRVYDITGRLVRTLADGRIAPGFHALTWDGRDSGGRDVAPGLYLVRLAVETEVETRKMVLLR